MQIKISYQEELSKKIEKKIHHGHVRDEAQAGIVCNYQKFSLVAHNKEEEIMGVLILPSDVRGKIKPALQFI